MQQDVIRKALAAAGVGLGVLVAACSEKGTAPTQRDMHVSAAVIPELPAFTERAPLDPFFINQPSEMMIRSDARTDFVIQRVVSDPGAGRWHTHPGPSFGIVKQGTVMITRWSKKTGCVSATYTAGQAYYEVADEIHRATVAGDVPAVEYKARFYAPVNGAFTSFPADADVPDCAAS